MPLPLKAELAEGRTIHLKLDIRLTPPISPIGHTDAALDIGRGLIKETIGILTMAAERDSSPRIG